MSANTDNTDKTEQVGGDDMKTYQQPDARETEQFWTKI